MSPAKSTTTTAATSTATNSNDNKDGNNLPNPTAAKGHLKTHRIQSAGSSGSIRARPALSSAGEGIVALSYRKAFQVFYCPDPRFSLESFDQDESWQLRRPGRTLGCSIEQATWVCRQK